MRDLFRGKRDDNGEWVEGYLLKYSPIYEEVTSILPLCSVCVLDIKVDPETVCQYTDSIDIGGNKIFEHDIVEEGSAVGIVKFGKYGNGFHFGYYIDWIICPNLRPELYFWADRVKVVGNIFDNPELLEKKNE